MSAIEIARQDLSISQLRAEAGRRLTPSRRGGFWPLPWAWMVIPALAARPVPWTADVRDWCIRYTRMLCRAGGPGPGLGSASSGEAQRAKWRSG